MVLRASGQNQVSRRHSAGATIVGPHISDPCPCANVQGWSPWGQGPRLSEPRAKASRPIPKTSCQWSDRQTEGLGSPRARLLNAEVLWPSSGASWATAQDQGPEIGRPSEQESNARVLEHHTLGPQTMRLSLASRYVRIRQNKVVSLGPQAHPSS